MGHLREWVEWAATFIEALAVVIMVGLILVGTAKWLFSGSHITEGYEHYRLILGKSLLVGLELLVAADIISTVALEQTLPAIGALGLLVLVRTFLGVVGNPGTRGPLAVAGEERGRPRNRREGMNAGGAVSFIGGLPVQSGER